MNEHVRTTLPDFAVIKQVAVAAPFARHGIGTRLYQHALNANTSRPVIAAVVTEPWNETSARFHERNGFTVHTRLTPPDGMGRVVYASTPPHHTGTVRVAA